MRKGADGILNSKISLVYPLGPIQDHFMAESGVFRFWAFQVGPYPSFLAFFEDLLQFIFEISVTILHFSHNI